MDAWVRGRAVETKLPSSSSRLVTSKTMFYSNFDTPSVLMEQGLRQWNPQACQGSSKLIENPNDSLKNVTGLAAKWSL